MPPFQFQWLETAHVWTKSSTAFTNSQPLTTALHTLATCSALGWQEDEAWAGQCHGPRFAECATERGAACDLGRASMVSSQQAQSRWSWKQRLREGWYTQTHRDTRWQWDGWSSAQIWRLLWANLNQWFRSQSKCWCINKRTPARNHRNVKIRNRRTQPMNLFTEQAVSHSSNSV